MGERECSTHNRQVCQNVPKKVCTDVNSPRQVCNDVPDEVCENKFASITKYIDDEGCSSSSARKCLPATREECQDVVKQVPRQTTKQECNTRYEEQCRQHTRVFPGRHSRPCAGLST